MASSRQDLKSAKRPPAAEGPASPADAGLSTPSLLPAAGTGAASERRRSIETTVADQVLGFVRSDGLPKGTHLPTPELAARFGVSRWPVLQALKALAGTGSIEYRPRRGFFVGDVGAPLDPSPPPPPDQVRDAYFRIAADLIGARIGNQVSESQIRERYDLTRGQAAALLNRMSQEGLAERRAGYGWSFSNVLATPEALGHSYQFRLMIEPASLLQKDYRLSREQIERLRRTERELLDGGIEQLPPDTLYEKASLFHETLISGTGNPFLIESLRRVNRVRRLLMYQSMRDRHRYFRQSEEHLHLLDLLEASRNEEASVFMHEHISGVMTRLREIGLLVPAEPQ